MVSPALRRCVALELLMLSVLLKQAGSEPQAQRRLRAGGLVSAQPCPDLVPVERIYSGSSSRSDTRTVEPRIIQPDGRLDTETSRASRFGDSKSTIVIPISKILDRGVVKRSEEEELQQPTPRTIATDKRMFKVQDESHRTKPVLRVPAQVEPILRGPGQGYEIMRVQQLQPKPTLPMPKQTKMPMPQPALPKPKKGVAKVHTVEVRIRQDSENVDSEEGDHHESDHKYTQELKTFLKPYPTNTSWRPDDWATSLVEKGVLPNTLDNGGAEGAFWEGIVDNWWRDPIPLNWTNLSGQGESWPDAYPGVEYHT